MHLLYSTAADANALFAIFSAHQGSTVLKKGSSLSIHTNNLLYQVQIQWMTNSSVLYCTWRRRPRPRIVLQTR
jgi:hypothetical protein